MRKTRCGAGIVATFIFLIVLASASALPAGIWPTAGMTQSGTPFSVPQWTSLRVRMEGDLFSATVMDAGDYQGARVYGTIRTIDNSGRFRGHTTMDFGFQSPGDARRPPRSDLRRNREAVPRALGGTCGCGRGYRIRRPRQEHVHSHRYWRGSVAGADSLGAGEARASARLWVAWQAWEVPAIADRR